MDEFEKLEQSELDEFEKLEQAESTAPAVPAGPVDYSQYMTPPGALPKRQPSAFEQYAAASAPVAPNMSASQSGREGMSLGDEIMANMAEADQPNFASGIPLVGDAVKGAKALYGVAQPLLREGIKEPLAGPITQAQTAIRESGFAKPVLDPALLLGGRPAETLAQNAMSLFIGSPENYQTTAEQESRAVEVADSKLAQTAGRVALGPAGLAVDPETAAGFAYTATKEAAYLPLYLIDARKAAGAVERAAIGGGLSEALDPRPESDVARGTVFAGGLGLGFKAAGALGGAAVEATRAAKWISSQNLAGDIVSRAGNAMELAVTPAAEFRLIANAPAAGAPKGGARASMYLVKPGDDGVLIAEKITVTKDGQKLSTVVPLEQTPLQKDFNAAISKVGNDSEPAIAALPKTNPGGTLKRKTPVLVSADDLDKLPEELRTQVTVFRDTDSVLPDVGTPDSMARGSAEITPRLDPSAPPQAFDIDTEHIPLHKLPNDDVMLSWPQGGNREFRVVSKRDMQLMSVKNRINTIVRVETPDGPLLAELPAVQAEVKLPKGELYVQPLDPAEKLGNSVQGGMIVPSRTITDLTDGDLNRLLDQRDAVLAQEALARVDASEAEAAMVAATVDPAVVIQTPTGPKIAVTSTQGQPPPQAMPPGPPSPQTPTPPTPVMANGNGGIVPPGAPIQPPPPPPTGGLVGRGYVALKTAGPGVVDLFINPAARGARGGLMDPRRVASFHNTEGRLVTLAADAAGAAQATGAIESLLPRMFSAATERTAAWLKALPPSSQAQFKRDVVKTLTSQNATVADLKLKWPQLAADIEAHVLDYKTRVAKNNMQLQAGGFQATKSFTAPEGFDKLAQDIIDDEQYLARLYLAPLAGPGEMKKMLELNRKLETDLLSEVAADLGRQGKSNSVIDARIELEKWLGNPEDQLARPPGSANTTNRQGAAALKDRRAGKLEVMGKTYAAWSKANPTAIKPSMRFVKGVINEAQLINELNRAGITLPPKDHAFLGELKEEVFDQLKPWQKKALRLVQDPFVQAPYSVVRQEALLVQMHAVKSAQAAGQVRTTAQLRLMGIDPVLEGWVQVSGDRSRWGDLVDGVGETQAWIAPEAVEGLSELPKAVRELQQFTANMVDSPHALVRVGIKAHFWAKTAYTVLSPTAWYSNTLGGLLGVQRAGVGVVDLFTNGSWKRAYTQWGEFVARPNEVTIRGQRITGADWMREGMKYGTVGNDAFSEEMRPMLKKLLRDDVLGVQGVSGFAKIRQQAIRLGLKIPEFYSAIDSIFRHGTWLTLLKKSGVDLDTGKLLDRSKADLMLNGGRFRQSLGRLAPSATAMDLSKMTDEQVVEAVKSAMAWRVRRSFSTPGTPGLATRAVAGASNASLGLFGNLFARTAMEEVRANAMWAHRARTEPGVASGALQWGALMGAMGLMIEHRRRASGISDEDVNTSIQGLPTGIRSYSPAMMGLWGWDDEGRVVALDLARSFEPLRYTGGDPQGRPIADQIGMDPGQFGARTAYNILIGSAFGGSAAGNILDTGARAAGLDIRDQYTPPELDEGFTGFSKRMARWLAPSLIQQVDSANTRRTTPGSAGVGEFLRPATANVLTVGGTPDQAAVNSRNNARYVESEADKQRALKGLMKRTEDEDKLNQHEQQLIRLKEKRGETMQYQEENP